MLQLHDKYERIITATLEHDAIFVSARNKAFDGLVNECMKMDQQQNSAQLVALYCDNLLRKSKQNDSDIDPKLASSMTILKYVQDKHRFQQDYQLLLARRFINDQLNMAAEKAMIHRFNMMAVWVRMCE